MAIIREPELRRQVRELGAVALLAKHWPVGPHKDANGAEAAGGRHDANLKVGGWLTRCGWSPERVARFLELVSVAAGAEPDKAKRRSIAKDAATRTGSDGKLYGWPSVVALFGAKVIDRAAEWLALARPAEAEPWPEPEELREGEEPEPFPLDALPPDVMAAVVEYQACGGQPVEMVVTAALATMSGCVQGLVDVRRDRQLVGPVSLNSVVIADSGERKTTCDNTFSAAAERWSRSESERIAPLYLDAKEARDAHQAQKQGLISALRDVAAKGKRAKGAAKDDVAADIDELKRQLREHGRNLQPLPPQPTPRVENGTKEGVENVLRSAWPSVAWASSEGANVTGGHGFKDDALLPHPGLLELPLGRRSDRPGTISRGLLADLRPAGERVADAAAGGVRGVHQGRGRSGARTRQLGPYTSRLAALNHGHSAARRERRRSGTARVGCLPRAGGGTLPNPAADAVRYGNHGGGRR